MAQILEEKFKKIISQTNLEYFINVKYFKGGIMEEKIFFNV